MDRRSPHSFSQIFSAHKTSTLRFHRCRSHILQKPPLVPRLGLHHPSPKVGIIPSFPSALNIRETRKITCYLTKPTHISPVLYAVHMVTRSTNRSLGSLAGSTTIQKQYLTSTHAIPRRMVHRSWCHTRFLRPKPDAHRMYAQDQDVIHAVRM
jgi:hypothetical protein